MKPTFRKMVDDCKMPIWESDEDDSFLLQLTEVDARKTFQTKESVVCSSTSKEYCMTTDGGVLLQGYYCKVIEYLINLFKLLI